MINNYSEQAKQRQTLVEAYRQLGKPEKLIVQMFAVIYEPINRTMALNCCNQLHQHNKKFKSFTGSSFAPVINGLIELKVLFTVSQGVRCHPLLVEVATRDVVQAGLFDPIVAVVEELMPLIPAWRNAPPIPKSLEQYMRLARWSIYRQNLPK
jgi:hypothetical protein